MKKGTKTTIVGVVIALVILGVMVLKYFGKLGEGLSEVFMAITGILTALGFFYAKDSTASHTHDKTVGGELPPDDDEG